MKKQIKINTKDNCVVSLVDDVAPRGHKIASEDIKCGEAVIKYGCEIGRAVRDIKKGEHIHVHNMETALGEKTTLEYSGSPFTDNSREGKKNSDCLKSVGANSSDDFMTASEKVDTGSDCEIDTDMKVYRTFQGYVREDGKVGIRNEVWILPLVGCVNDIAKAIEKASQDKICGSVEGIYAFTHPYGCSQTGQDHENTRKLLTSLALHPNAGAVLVVGLGCENLTMEQFKESLIKESGMINEDRIKFMLCQDYEDELTEGEKLIGKCVEYGNRFCREEVSVDKLVIGMKCGGSDGLSGITANPAVGALCDKVTEHGGTAILTEVPEMFGAEQILLPRCKDRDVFDKAVGMINDFKEYFISYGEKIYENPSPGNKAGGITTLEDKSCGCVQKGGTSVICGVLKYGERIGRDAGLHLLYGPGNDLVSCTALAAAGAQLILFTTGRGTPFGGPVPTVKISTNTQLKKRKGNWIDFDAGVIVSEEDVDAKVAGERLFEEVINYAGGKPAKNEINGYREIAIFKTGVTL